MRIGLLLGAAFFFDFFDGFFLAGLFGALARLVREAFCASLEVAVFDFVRRLFVFFLLDAMLQFTTAVCYLGKGG